MEGGKEEGGREGGGRKGGREGARLFIKFAGGELKIQLQRSSNDWIMH